MDAVCGEFDASPSDRWRLSAESGAKRKRLSRLHGTFVAEARKIPQQR
jgi:hypothetical protein